MNRDKTVYFYALHGNPRRTQSGLSLVEIMVAMVISLFLLAGVVQIFLGSKQSYTVNEGLSRLQENARFAFDRIGQDLAASGYMGCNESDGRDPEGNLYIHNALTINSTTKYNFSNPLDGTEGAAGAPDTLSVRRAITSSSVPLADDMDKAYSDIVLDNAHPNYAALEQWQTMAIADCHKAAIFMITNNPATSGGVIEHDPGIISPVGQPNEGQSNAGTPDDQGIIRNDLQAEGMGGDQASEASIIRVATNTYDIQMGDSGLALFLNGTEFVEGIEDMQVLYGLDADGTLGAERYVAANDAALTDMNQVASVQISLTMNTVDNVQIQGQPLTKTFTQTFRLRNR